MGKSAVIIGNGLFPATDFPLYLIREASYIVCCDGALETYFDKLPHGKSPDAVVGDMDSISDPDPNLAPARSAGRFKGRYVCIKEQDDNDQTKAFRYVIEHFKDIETIHFIGATGLREDHTLGNMALLMEYTRMFDLRSLGISIDIVSDFSTIFPITDSETLTVGEGRRISIFTPDNTLRIKSQGLVWPTDDVIFDNWWKATLNRASSDTLTLTFSHPSLALIVLD